MYFILIIIGIVLYYLLYKRPQQIKENFIGDDIEYETKKLFEKFKPKNQYQICKNYDENIEASNNYLFN